MTNEEKKRIADLVAERICSYYSYEGCKYEHILKALDRIDKIDAYKHAFERDTNYRVESNIDDDKLFAANIDDSIKYLKELKEAGWTRIEEEWSGYETNYFVACKYIKEPEDAYKSRITDFVEDFIPGILNEEKDIREKEKMIAQLKKELNELKSKKRLWEIN